MKTVQTTPVIGTEMYVINMFARIISHCALAVVVESCSASKVFQSVAALVLLERVHGIARTHCSPHRWSDLYLVPYKPSDTCLMINPSMSVARSQAGYQ